MIWSIHRADGPAFSFAEPIEKRIASIGSFLASSARYLNALLPDWHCHAILAKSEAFYHALARRGEGDEARHQGRLLFSRHHDAPWARGLEVFKSVSLTRLEVGSAPQVYYDVCKAGWLGAGCARTDTSCRQHQKSPRAAPAASRRLYPSAFRLLADLVKHVVASKGAKSLTALVMYFVYRALAANFYRQIIGPTAAQNWAMHRLMREDAEPLLTHVVYSTNKGVGVTVQDTSQDKRARRDTFSIYQKPPLGDGRVPLL